MTTVLAAATLVLCLWVVWDQARGVERAVRSLASVDRGVTPVETRDALYPGACGDAIPRAGRRTPPPP